MGRPMRTDFDRQLMRQMGIRLRWVREALGLSQEDMGEHVGLHQTTWSLYERGQRMPDAFAMVRLCGKLKVSREYLLEGSLDGVDRDLAIRLAAAHPELVPPTRKGPRTDKPPF